MFAAIIIEAGFVILYQVGCQDDCLLPFALFYSLTHAHTRKRTHITVDIHHPRIKTSVLYQEKHKLDLGNESLQCFSGKPKRIQIHRGCREVKLSWCMWFKNRTLTLLFYPLQKVQYCTCKQYHLTWGGAVPEMECQMLPPSQKCPSLSSSHSLDCQRKRETEQRKTYGREGPPLSSPPSSPPQFPLHSIPSSFLPAQRVQSGDGKEKSAASASPVYGGKTEPWD